MPAVAVMGSASSCAGSITTALTLRHDIALSECGRMPDDRLAAIAVSALALALDGIISAERAFRVVVGVSAAVMQGTGRTIDGQNPAVAQTVLALIRM